jgi:hypothetical protein
MRTALLVIALGSGSIGCGPLAPPAPATLPPPAKVELPTLAPLVGAWRGADGTGWTYQLTITADGTFDQSIERGPGDRCHQVGQLQRVEPEGDNFQSPLSQLARVSATFSDNDCSPNFAGGGSMVIVQALAPDHMVLRWTDATVTLTRAAAPAR